MDELPPRARALIELVRDAHDPEPADRTRVRQALAVAIGQGGPAQGSASTGGDAAGSAGAATTSGGVGAKLALSAAVVATAGALFVTRPWQGAPEPASASHPATSVAAPRAEEAQPSKPPVATKLTAEHDEDRADEQSGQVAVPEPAARLEPAKGVQDEPSSVAHERVTRPQRTITRETAKQASAARAMPRAAEADQPGVSGVPNADAEPALQSGQLAALAVAETVREPSSTASVPPAVQGGGEELALIGAAMRALRDGRPGDALASITEHAARFPQGVLREEREGLRVLSTCALGRTATAQRLRERFLQASPDSPMAERVRAACRPAEE